MTSRARSRLAELVNDLRRRRVFRVAAVYLLVGWGLVQVATNTFPYLPVPEWLITAVIVVVALGFPLAVFLAWAFDLQITRDSGSPDGAAHSTPRGRLIAPLLPRARSTQPGKAARGRAPSAPSVPPDAERVSRAVLANLRHELRNPLNAVIGYSEMLLEDTGTADAALAQRLGGLITQARALLPRIDDLAPPREPDAQERWKETLQTMLPAVHAAARELAANAQALVGSLPNGAEPELTRDAGRIALAAQRLTTVLDELDARGEGGAESEAVRESRVVAERVLSRLTPLQAGTVAATSASILVVDDNALNRDLLCRQLARSGFTVASASGGSEALERLRTGRWDLVLLDVMMPDIDGLEVLDRIQQDERLSALPVIMISAIDEIDSVVRCLEMGAADYIPKPFDPVLLRARIGAVLELRQLREQPQRLSQNLLEAETWNQRLAGSILPRPWSADAGMPREDLQVLPDATVLVVELRATPAAAPDEVLAAVRASAAVFVETAEHYAIRTLVGGRRFIAFAAAPECVEHADAIAGLALELAEKLPNAGSAALNPGLGLQSGSVALGVAAEEQVLCGLWGDAIDGAERLAASAPQFGVALSATTHGRLTRPFEAKRGGVVEFSDGTQMRVYHLESHTPAAH